MVFNRPHQSSTGGDGRGETAVASTSTERRNEFENIIPSRLSCDYSHINETVNKLLVVLADSVSHSLFDSHSLLLPRPCKYNHAVGRSFISFYYQNNHDLVILGTFYIPYATYEKIFTFCQILEEISVLYPSAIFVIMGDLNMPFAIWNTEFDNGPGCTFKPGTFRAQRHLTELISDTMIIQSFILFS